MIILNIYLHNSGLVLYLAQICISKLNLVANEYDNSPFRRGDI